jgi:hypothetical protein
LAETHLAQKDTTTTERSSGFQGLGAEPSTSFSQFGPDCIACGDLPVFGINAANSGKTVRLFRSNGSSIPLETVQRYKTASCLLFLMILIPCQAHETGVSEGLKRKQDHDIHSEEAVPFSLE